MASEGIQQPRPGHCLTGELIEQTDRVHDNRESFRVIHIGLAESTQSSSLVLRVLKICQMAPQQANVVACSGGINSFFFPAK